MSSRVQHRLRSREDRAPSARCQLNARMPPLALDVDSAEGTRTSRSVVAVRTEDFWLEKRAHSLSRLVGRRPLPKTAGDIVASNTAASTATAAITPPPSSSSMLRQSLFDSAVDDDDDASPGNGCPGDDAAWDLTKESLTRTDSSASLYNDWSQHGSGLLPGSLRALSEVCEQSAWLWCGDLPLPDSPDSTFEDSADSESARVLHETFLPTMESDDGILTALLETAGRNSKTGTPLPPASHQLVHLLEDCVETFGVDDETDSGSESESDTDDGTSSDGDSDDNDSDDSNADLDGDSESDGGSQGNGDGDDDDDDSDGSMSEMCCSEYDESCSETEEGATPSAVSAGAGIAATTPTTAAATASLMATLLAATSQTPPPQPPPPQAPQSHPQATSRQPIAAAAAPVAAAAMATDDQRHQRPAGVFSYSTHGVFVPPTPPPLDPLRHLIPHSNFPHPGSAVANKPFGHVFAPPAFYHSLSSTAVASASAAALQPSRDLLLQSRGIATQAAAQGVATTRGGRRRRPDDEPNEAGSEGNGARLTVAAACQAAEDVAGDDGGDGDGACAGDGDGDDEGDDEDVRAKKVKAVRVRRLTVDRSHRYSIPSPLQLWEYVLHLLELGKLRESIRWIDADVGSFRIVDSVSLGRQWGAYRSKPRMNYDKMSRAMRYYYRRNIFVQIDGRLVYRYAEPVMRQVRAFRKAAAGKGRGRT